MNGEVVPEPLWGAADARCFDSRLWNDDTVVYVVATGETHALAPHHGVMLAELMADPDLRLTAAQWLNRLADGGESCTRAAQPDPMELVAVLGALVDLHRIGVVERVAA